MTEQTPDRAALIESRLRELDTETLIKYAAEQTIAYTDAFANWQAAERANAEYVVANNTMQEQLGVKTDEANELRDAYNAAADKLAELEAYKASTQEKSSGKQKLAAAEEKLANASADAEHLAEVAKRRLDEVEAANKRVADLEAALKTSAVNNAELNNYARELERLLGTGRDSMGIIKPAGL